MADDNVIRPAQFNEAADILKAVPEDLRDTYDYIVDHDVMGDSNMTNDARLIARVCTLGQALVELKKQRPDIKARIKMPEPRQQPWKNLPVLLIGGRPPPGALVRLNNRERANLLVLFRACGFRSDGIKPFTFMRGFGWLGELGLKIEGDEKFDSPIDVEPDVTYAELGQRVREWKDGDG